jgi:hypothetical protein
MTRYNFVITVGAKQHNQAQKTKQKEKKRKENNANID